MIDRALTLDGLCPAVRAGLQTFVVFDTDDIWSDLALVPVVVRAQLHVIEEKDDFAHLNLSRVGIQTPVRSRLTCMSLFNASSGSILQVGTKTRDDARRPLSAAPTP
jgi:hypothetical protein